MHIVKCQYEDWKIIPTDLANNILAKNTLKEGSFAFYLNDWGDFCLMKEREAAESKRREQKDEKAADNAGWAPQAQGPGAPQASLGVTEFWKKMQKFLKII